MSEHASAEGSAGELVLYATEDGQSRLFLRAEGGTVWLNQAELADLLEVERITLCRMVDRLADAGLVERRADPGDRRRWRLHLTAKAHAVVDEMEVIAGGLRNEALQGIAPDDFDTLLRVLGQIKNNLAAINAADDTRGTP